MKNSREGKWEKYAREHTTRFDKGVRYSIRKSLPETNTVRTILDVGCGSGEYTKILSNLGNTIASDISFIQCERLKKLGFKCIQADALHLPLKSNSFDLILANQVVEHIEDPISFAKELIRVCKVSGRILITTPNRFSPTRIIQLTFKNYLDETHVREYNLFTIYLYKMKLSKMGVNCLVRGYSSMDNPSLSRLWKIFPENLKKVLACFVYHFPAIGRGFLLQLNKKFP